jgi:flavin reductase (DIM6/NTAB) family NADH-FMN oxidoreductase RutF
MKAVAMHFDLGELGQTERAKLLKAIVTPRPIAWVVSNSTIGQVNVAPFSFFNLVSTNPPTIVVGIESSARGAAPVKDTLANVRESGFFSVNLVSRSVAHAMAATAKELPPGVNEAALAKLTLVPGKSIPVPHIAESPASMECSVVQEIDLGSGSALIVATVLAIRIEEEFILDAQRFYVDTPRLDLVARMHGAGWYASAPEFFQL